MPRAVFAEVDEGKLKSVEEVGRGWREVAALGMVDVREEESVQGLLFEWFSATALRNPSSHAVTT